MYGILSDLMDWLNFNIMSFLDGIKIQQKSLLLHNFSGDLSLFLLKKNQGSLSSKNQLCVLMSFLLIMHIVFHHKTMSGFFFFCLE